MTYVPGSHHEPLWLRATAIVDRLYSAFCAVREELALAYVAPRTWRAAVLAHYDQHAPFYRDQTYHATGLFAWESRAIAQWFPPPPSTILVGGAGAGRETLALVGLGYHVAAFEPAAALFEALRDHLAQAGIDAPVALGGYEDLVAALDGASAPDDATPLRALCRGRIYDAVILGFGSFSCCTEAATRTRLLAALARLCPTGPVLLSFEPYRTAAGRAAALARCLRRWLRCAPASRPVMPGDQLDDSGFQHAFTQGEIETLARDAGYRVAATDREPYPHAVLVRAASRAALL